MRIFLTGASGYLGHTLVERFAREPEIEGITGIDLLQPTAPLPPKVKFVEMDIRSPDLITAMAGHHEAVHTAFIVKWMAQMPAKVRDDINLNGARNVAQAAVVNKVRRFILASSMAAYEPRLVRGEVGVTEDFPIGTGDSFGVKFVPVVPLWLARVVAAVRWRYFGSATHPSWVEALLADFTGSNTKLRAAGWKPKYGSAEALRTAL
jgi:nucleoside-diphosphate-sugar epimerase